MLGASCMRLASRKMKLLALLLWALPLAAQSDVGEIRLKVAGPDGVPLKSSVQLVCEANDFEENLTTDDAGSLTMRRLPFGIYRLQVQHDGLAPYTAKVEIRSAIPFEQSVTLRISPLNTSVTVTDTGTLIDTHATSSVNRIGSAAIESRATSLPGRSLEDLVNTQPGWLYEGNAVLHPRGSEYQTQLVVDGIPFTDNRSPGFAPELEADDVQTMSVYTGGIPAEYGRKMGGVIEVNTARDARPGWHGKVVASGGSFTSADGYGLIQYGEGKNTFSVAGSGGTTDWYLNPPVTQNYTNQGTTSSFAARYERDFDQKNRLGLFVRHAQSAFEVPNELVQQSAGQRQNRTADETMGIASYQHIFSPNVLADMRVMGRDETDTLSSNLLSTPIIAAQDRGFGEFYFKTNVAIHRSHQEWKAGVEADSLWLHERFGYIITDPSQFDPGTPLTFRFFEQRPDLEQAAYVQDLIRLGNWTVNAGLRWDHYQLLVNQNAVSPRIAVGRYFPAVQLLVHAAYDRVFQTPAFENILLSSSPDVSVLNPNVLRLPVEPSHGNYFEVGATKGLFNQLRLDLNYYRREVNQFADDDLLLNTGISFPIAFRSADIYGAEAKLDIPHWGRVSGFVSYSYMVGTAYLPVTGGLFLGDDATHALTNNNGSFWVSQDQRNTVRARGMYRFVPRAWIALGGSYGSGLPVEFSGTFEQALEQYGPTILSHVDFRRGRVKPSYSLDLSAGVDLHKTERLAIYLQGDVQNITNQLDLINFAGLFSGNTLGPPRSYSMRLGVSF